MNLHSNATPNLVFTGAQDNPRPGASPVAPAFANFTLLNIFKAPWGPLNDAMAVNDSVVGNRIYGEEAFDVSGPYFNYQTSLATLMMSKAVSQFMLRVADETVTKAGGRLMIEYVADDIDPQNRNADGSYVLDVDGNTTDSGTTVAGYKIRFLWEQSDGTLVTGTGAQLEGTLVGKDGETSTILPIVDFEGTYYGTRGNRFLAALFQPKVTNPIVVDRKSIEQTGNMVYRFGVRESSLNGGTSTVWYTQDSNETMDFCLKPGGRDRNNAVIDFETRYAAKYKLRNQLTNGQNVVGPVDGIKWYNDNIKTVLDLLLAAEVAARPSVGDNTIWIDENNAYSINLFGGTNHQAIPYRAIQHVGSSALAADARQVSLSGAGYVLGLAGGTDGALDDDTFNTAVATLATTFDKKIPLHDIKQYPFHWVLDNGLKTETTEKLYEIMSYRPDVIVIGAAHEHGNIEDEDTMMAMEANLYGAAALMPESVIYSTPATRGAVMPYCMKIGSGVNSLYNEPVSLNYALAEKFADYLGSNDLVWRQDKDPLAEENKNIDHEVLNYRYGAFSTRETAWLNQAIAVESTGHNTIGFVGVQSINPNDSSVLNSLLVVAGLVQANWAMAMAYGAHAGLTTTPGIMKQKLDAKVTELTKGIDPDKVRVVPGAVVTPDDEANAFSITMRSKLTGGQMFTAMTATIESSYFEDNA